MPSTPTVNVTLLLHSPVAFTGDSTMEGGMEPATTVTVATQAEVLLAESMAVKVSTCTPVLTKVPGAGT